MGECDIRYISTPVLVLKTDSFQKAEHPFIKLTSDIESKVVLLETEATPLLTKAVSYFKNMFYFTRCNWYVVLLRLGIMHLMKLCNAQGPWNNIKIGKPIVYKYVI